MRTSTCSSRTATALLALKPATCGSCNKSLYGLKQAGRAWNKKMDAALVDLGFRPSHSDSCVYVRRQADSGAVLYLLVYVDDILLVSDSTAELTAVKTALSSRFDMKDMGEAEFILGVQIRRDRPNRRLCLSQAEYVRDCAAAVRHGALQVRAHTDGYRCEAAAD